jgi:hypothetical protein
MNERMNERTFTFSHEESHDLRMLPLDGQMQRRLEVHVRDVHVAMSVLHQHLRHLEMMMMMVVVMMIENLGKDWDRK